MIAALERDRRDKLIVCRLLSMCLLYIHTDKLRSFIASILVSRIFSDACLHICIEGEFTLKWVHIAQCVSWLWMYWLLNGLQLESNRNFLNFDDSICKFWQTFCMFLIYWLKNFNYTILIYWLNNLINWKIIFSALILFLSIALTPY